MFLIKYINEQIICIGSRLIMQIIDNNEAWGGSSPLSQLTSNFGIDLNITKLLRFVI